MAAGNNFTLSQPFGGSFPRWKGNTTLSLGVSPVQCRAVAGNSSARTRRRWLLPTQALSPAADKVGSYSEFNLMMTYTGFKHWTIYGGMDNIFNRTPPFDPLFADSELDQTGYDQSLYSYIGRFVQVGATYKF
jgi:iron complex outermembrane receptor protein